ncbi:conserved hypothetical protein [Bradyrhizobium sp. ORS 278]|uniref:hypothetical protein n=1 Tax=Bradyrhizobium sp. (strain ORS 278) TaxID=114615 RepID=UPI0001507C3D|nr:hypothetical protein [Bradyrhizobium sp. ORS 278]CAL76337.1 conserved hypothetical protein [Bradyrhizobium sp. ORS 278]
MTNKSGDPIAFWQQMVGDMQRSFTAFTRLRPIGGAIRTSDDPATSGNGQKPMADLMENYFAGMNVPSRGQLTVLNERLTSIESELAETRALLKELLASRVAPPAPAADPTPKLNEIKGLIDTLVAASKLPPPVVPTPADVTPKLSEIKTLLDALVAASNTPQPAATPAVDVTPQLSEIKALLDQILKSVQAPTPAAALETDLREIRNAIDALTKSSPPAEGEAPSIEAAPRAAEPVRHGKRNKKHGGMPDRNPGPRQDVPSGS